MTPPRRLVINGARFPSAGLEVRFDRPVLVLDVKQKLSESRSLPHITLVFHDCMFSRGDVEDSLRELLEQLGSYEDGGIKWRSIL